MASVGSLPSAIAWLLPILVVGHVGIALLHHLVNKDDVLQRMI